MKVNWLLPTDERDPNRVLASIWIRCLQLIPFLEERGIECVINEPHSDAPICYFVRWQDETAHELARAAKKRGKKIIFDLVANYFDDSEYIRNKARLDECAQMVQIADVITTCSDHIAQRARHEHDWVEYLPDTVNLEHFRYRKPESDFFRRKLRIVWSGTSEKMLELEPILPLIRKHGFFLYVISDKKQVILRSGRWWRRGFPYEFKRWHYDSFPRDILHGDVCVSFRETDSPYNRGHSFFKIGVMMAQGLPAIASPVPAYLELVNEQTQAGYICRSVAEWDQAFQFLQQNRDWLAKCSQRARSALEPYATRNFISRYEDLFDRIM